MTVIGMHTAHTRLRARGGRDILDPINASKTAGRLQCGHWNHFSYYVSSLYVPLQAIDARVPRALGVQLSSIALAWRHNLSDIDAEMEKIPTAACNVHGTAID